MKAIDDFVASLTTGYAKWPLGGDEFRPALVAEERALLEAWRSTDSRLSEHAGGVRELPDLKSRYAIGIVGLRSVVYATRANDAALFRTGLELTLAAGGSVDWRDLLGALAIIEDCAGRLGIDARTLELEIAREIGMPKLEEVITGYWDREPAMRKTRVMGIDTIGTSDDLWYSA